MRTIFVVLGVVLLLTGSLFVGQGSGRFPYPRSSFMVGASPWTVRGAVIAAAGVLLLLAALRLGRR